MPANLRRLPELLAAAALAAVIAFSTASFGARIQADSTRYLTEAASLRDGHGPTIPFGFWGSVPLPRPMTHLPPLYALTLAGLSKTSRASPADCARWLNVAAIFALTLLLGGLIPSKPLPRAAALAFLVGPALLDQHAAIMSEPLFLSLCAAALLAWHRLAPDRSMSPLVVGALAGASCQARYAGYFWVLALPGLYLLLGTADLRRRIRQAALALGTLGLVVLPWFVWLSGIGRGPRQDLAFHAAGAAFVGRGVSCVAAWFLPRAIPEAARVAIFAAIAGIGVWAWLRTRRTTDRPRSDDSAILCAATYLSFVWLSESVAPGIEMTNRMLAPVALFLAIAAARALDPPPRRWALAVALALVAATFASGARASARNLMATATTGGLPELRSVFSSRRWRDSEAVAWLRRLPSGVTAFSNRAEGIATLVGIPGWLLPTPDRAPGITARQIRQAIDAAAPAVVVIFGAPVERSRTALDVREALADLEAIELDDATVYRIGFPRSPRAD